MTYLGDVVSHARHDMTTSGGVREGMALADSMFQYTYNGGVREGNMTASWLSPTSALRDSDERLA